MVAALLSRFTILVFGILYPAYSSFKAVRRKSHRDYTKWMMYWIVFALFQALEMVTDIFLPWLPLYYEIKICFVLWLVLPIFEGSKQMYRMIIHPFLVRHEERIDQGIAQAGKTGFDTIKKVSQAGLNKAATTFVTSAIKGQSVINETLLRVADQQRQAGTDGQDMTDHPDPSRELMLEDGQRSRVSSLTSDLEPFEVIGEDPEVLHHSPPQSSDKFWENSQQGSDEGLVWTAGSGNNNTADNSDVTTDNNDITNSVYYHTHDYYDRTVPQYQS